MEFSNSIIEMMRFELANPEKMKERIAFENKMESLTREQFKKEGRDFDKEFKKFKLINGVKK